MHALAAFRCELPAACPTDLDGDGVTGISDFLALLGLFGYGCD